MTGALTRAAPYARNDAQPRAQPDLRKKPRSPVSSTLSAIGMVTQVAHADSSIRSFSLDEVLQFVKRARTCPMAV